VDFELRGGTLNGPALDLNFPHHWQAEVLPWRPAILPARHYVYPRQAEEVERGALEVLIRPGASKEMGAPGPDFETGDSTTLDPPTLSPSAQPFLATCALGFRDPAVPTGLWSTPNPEKICAVAGGYAYIIDTTMPDRFTMIPYRPALCIVPAVEACLLLFVGHHSILAWGRDGQAWESEKLSDEGVTITAIENGILHGKGWHILTDKETNFALDLRSGARADS
jgi:hypothetical protein